MIFLYRLLIVDDEPDVLAALVSYFIEQDGLDVLAADSAVKAIDILDAERIDILLSDINMPGVDGLELLRHVQANWSDCRTIFLTGFAEFDYIYQANELGAAGFLLKTEGKEKIVAAVWAEVQNIRAGQPAAALPAAARQSYIQRAFLLRETVATLLAEGQNSQLTSLLAQLCPALNLTQPFMLAACQIGRQGRPDITVKADFLHGLENLAWRYLGGHFTLLLAEKEHWQLLFLLQPQLEGPGRAAAGALARGCFEKIQDILLENQTVYASIAILDELVPLAGLAAASCQLAHSLAGSLADGAGIQLIRSGQIQPGQPADENQAVVQVRAMIDKSYDQALSLTWLAGQVYLNPSYLSRLFRQQMGMTLVSYLNQVRLERACELLLTSNMKIIDIAAATGFASASYFNQAFRKQLGQTPAEFRQKAKKASSIIKGCQKNRLVERPVRLDN